MFLNSDKIWLYIIWFFADSTQGYSKEMQGHVNPVIAKHSHIFLEQILSLKNRVWTFRSIVWRKRLWKREVFMSTAVHTYIPQLKWRNWQVKFVIKMFFKAYDHYKMAIGYTYCKCSTHILYQFRCEQPLNDSHSLPKVRIDIDILSVEQYVFRYSVC